MGHAVESGKKVGSPQRVVGVHDETQLMSRPAGQASQPTFVPGPVNAAGATEAYGNYAEHPKITLQPQSSDQNMTPALPRHDYSQDVSRTDRPESRRREDEMRAGPESTMSEYTPRAKKNPPAHGIDGQNVSAMPPQRTFGESVKIGVGKVWSGVQSVFGPSEPSAPTQMPVVNPDGTYGDHHPDGTPLQTGAVPGGGTRS